MKFKVDDNHHRALKAISSKLKERFNQSGLALSGSVAKNEHCEDSDVDVLVVDRNFERELQFSTKLNSVDVAIICLNSSVSDHALQNWRMSGIGHSKILSLVRSSVVLHDPNGYVTDLKQKVNRVDMYRQKKKDKIVSEIVSTVGEWMENRLHHNRYSILVNSVSLLVSALNVIHNLDDFDKYDNVDNLKYLESNHPHLFDLLVDSIPITEDSYDSICELVEYIREEARLKC